MQAFTQCEQTLSTLGVGQEVVHDRRMLFHELVSVSMSKRTRLNILKNIFPMLTKYLKYILSHLKYNIWWCGKIFCHVSWMNEIYGWKYGCKMTMDEFFHEHSQ